MKMLPKQVAQERQMTAQQMSCQFQQRNGLNLYSLKDKKITMISSYHQVFNQLVQSNQKLNKRRLMLMHRRRLKKLELRLIKLMLQSLHQQKSLLWLKRRMILIQLQSTTKLSPIRKKLNMLDAQVSMVTVLLMLCPSQLKNSLNHYLLKLLEILTI
jgi:hypothetical protein